MIEFHQVEHTATIPLIRMALAEDVGDRGDLTTAAIIAAADTGQVAVVARAAGVVCGQPVAELVMQQIDSTVVWDTLVADGSTTAPGTTIASVSGSLQSLLTGERTALNFLTHLSGIATLTQRFVNTVTGTRAIILDTRKTIPAYRVLHKYAVRCGGGHNHRMGLHDGILIKDNHLAAWSEHADDPSVRSAVVAAQQFRQTRNLTIPIEVEVDTLNQLRNVLLASPDIVLLDNMPPSQLRDAVSIRDKESPRTRLEASGGVTLDTVRAIAESGVDRISIGALTHSAPAFDIAFDWSTR